MSTLMKIFKWIIDLLKSYFDMKSELSKNEQDKNKHDNELIEKMEDELDVAHNAIEHADEDAINEIFKSIIIVFSIITLSGCVTKTIYIPENEKIESIIHNGIEGYFVPKAKMVQLADEHIKYKYYLKKYGPLN